MRRVEAKEPHALRPTTVRFKCLHKTRRQLNAPEYKIQE